ncbi:MAG: mechanosensitive ion channel family protein [Chromatiaceae bacterium]|jgi:small-conductance mechanosensitive channel|nr:mechanosensitive ion channel family protein [Chromatiaceae bacterium]
MNEDTDLARLFNTLDSGALIELTLILLGTIVLITGSQKLLPWIASRMHGRAHYYVLALIPALRLLILIGGVLLIVPILIEPSLQNMVAVLGAVGLAIGFALKDYVSSLIAGVVSTVELDYRPGDWIEVGGVYGEVRRVGMRTVQIVTPDDTLVSIPHLKLWSEPVHNANNGGPSLQCVANFYLHPGHDAGQVCQALRDVTLTSPYLQLDQPVTVVAQERPWGTHYRIRAYPIHPSQQFRFVTDLTVRGKAALERIGAMPAAVPATFSASG